ncbi:1-phosphofructokinase [Propionispora sp. 2/2-37]|uniref:1-phosphofructokinase n=1 Tax=Propionispora sp. 2/2-37 TaxID=1677858 RepID=UPI0006BB7F44|nr:1-phosphofructokinase [Propionispora sp. 2/2-37]CUH94315.1 1-phosphofructokinase [Propionispora sp. 2/2-37]
MSTRVLTVTLNAAVDHTLYFPSFQVGQLNRVENNRLDPAGKGVNVAKVIKALGQEVAVTGFLGKDNLVPFTNYFAAAGIIDHFIKVDGSTRVNMKIVDESTAEVTEINFPGVTCQAKDLAALELEIRLLAQQGGLFVFSGSLPKGVPDDIYGRYINLLHTFGCKVFLDSSGKALEEGIKGRPYAVKPNINELSQMVGRSLDSVDQVRQVADELLAGGIEQVTVSLGARGAMIVSKAGSWLAEPPDVEVKSTVGAGDAMVAGLVLGEAQSLPLERRIRLATATAVASVMLPGTQACTMSDVEHIMSLVKITEVKR